MSDRNHLGGNDRIILAAKTFGIWLVCGTLFEVAIEKNFAVGFLLLWFPITLVASMHAYLSGSPSLLRTFLIIIAVIFVFLVALIPFAMIFHMMVDINLLILFYPFVVGAFCWWLTKIIANPR